MCGSLSDTPPPSWLPEEQGRYFCFNADSRVRYPGAIARLAGLLRRERIDILQTHLFDAGVVGVLAARLARRPLAVVTRHHMDDVLLGGTRFHVAIDRWMAKKAARVVVPSRAVRNHMTSRERLNGERIEVIHYGFDFQALSATDDDRRRVRAEFGLGSEFVIGCIARFFRNKGHAYLISAMEGIVEAVPQARLLLLGGGDKAEVERMVRERKLEKHVIFAGHRKDVPACIRAMDVVVHPSLSEAFCQVIIETMGVGTALVATDVGGASEAVTSRETGMLVPPAAPAAISEAVLELYQDPGLRGKIAAAGQKNVRERFTVERMVGKQIECYERLLAPSLERNDYVSNAAHQHRHS